MQIEYEATFTNINKDDIRARLNKAGAKLIRPEFMQRRVVFNLPKGHEIKGAWLRIRDEGDKITLTLKIVDGDKIENQKEISLVVDNFQVSEELLSTLGASKKAFQESKRELWELDGLEITIDEWPWLEPFVEIEGKSEKAVKKVAKKLEFNYDKAWFGAVDGLYSQKYNISTDQINNHTKEIKFGEQNPFG